VDERGENQIAVASGANGALTGEMVGAALQHRVEEDPRGVVLLGHEVPEEAVLAGACAARAAGWTVILNPAPARPLPDGLDGVLVTPNAEEARALTGEQDPEAAARALQELTDAPVLVTLGARGALLLAEEVERLAAPVVTPVDTTGAGDTVNGALAAELAAGRELRDAACFALAAAALSTQAAGAREGMPRRHEVP
jgi:ribokinase